MKKQIVIRLLSFSFLIGLFLTCYENCGKIGFKDLENSIQGKTYYSLGACQFGCFKREINASESVAKPHVKVVMVVDNSSSMSANQQSFANGVQTLIDDLAGIDSSFYLYSTTQESTGKKTTTIRSQGCNDDDGHGSPIPCSNGAPQAGHTYTNFTKWDLAPNLMPTPLHLATDSSPTEFGNVKAQLVNNIIAVGTNGTPNEEGICTLARTVYETGPNKIFNSDNVHTDGPDVAAFVVISDDNDKTIVSDGSINRSCHSHEDATQSCYLDTTPVPNVGTVDCTDPACTYYNQSYSSTMSGNPVGDKVVYNYSRTKQSEILHVNYKTQHPPISLISYNYTYSLGTVVINYTTQVRSFDGQFVHWTDTSKNLYPYTLTSCDPSTFNASVECSKNMLALNLDPNNERLVNGSCQASCTPSTNTGSANRFFAPSCNGYPSANGTSADCSSDLDFLSRVPGGRTILSCNGSCRVTTSTAISQSLPDTYPLSCTAGDCSASQLTAAQAKTDYVSGSCNVTCSDPSGNNGSAPAPSSVTCSQDGQSCKNAVAKSYLQSLGLNYFASDEDFSATDTCTIHCDRGTTPTASDSKIVRQNASVQNVDYCTNTYIDNGTTYPNIEKYFEQKNGMTGGICTKGTAEGPHFDKTPIGGTHPANVVKCNPITNTPYSFPPNQPIAPGQDVAAAFTAQAKQMFQSNYLVSALVSTQTLPWMGDQVSTCADHSATLWAPIGVGQRYIDLVTQAGNNGAYDSVCAPKYSVSLSKISNWIKTTTNQIYHISDVADIPNTIIIEVWISNSSGHHNMVVGQDVEISGSTIKFLQDGIIQPGDRIGYTLAYTQK